MQITVGKLKQMLNDASQGDDSMEVKMFDDRGEVDITMQNGFTQLQTRVSFGIECNHPRYISIIIPE